MAANVGLPRAEGLEYRDVETAAQLGEATKAAFARADVLLMAAAVSDFRPRSAETDKIARAGRDGLSVELEPTEDVLAALGRRAPRGADARGLRRGARPPAPRSARGRSSSARASTCSCSTTCPLRGSASARMTTR